MNDSSLFYDDLSEHYHLIFQDWEKSRKHQAQVLDELFQNHFKAEKKSVLDCACGIGTQALGLAELGYEVTATDLSPKAVDQVRRRAAQQGLEMTYGVADFRSLSDQVTGEYDIVLNSGNSLTHLLTDKDMNKAAQNLLLKTRPGGLLVISIRDYDEILKAPPQVTPVRVFDTPSGQRVYFQIWDWSADECYDFQLFILESDSDGVWQTNVFNSNLKAWRREPLAKIFRETGFSSVKWRMPQETGHHWPIMTATRPGGGD